ncbi:MAG: 16S rRNA (guanine(966)-N(2))-methyltransferase RsmD [Lentisphaerae bacterium]|nr:16S rRNA (guanine(966)-N(2))-methyltransferase RsmD [Lentisphaerota bacterium]
MRITSGIFKGHVIKAPPGRVRPTGDMVKHAFFSTVSDRIKNSRFLDLFSGSGAIGLEAFSVGASHVEMVELDRNSLSVIYKNLEKVVKDVDVRKKQFVIHNKDAFRFVKSTEYTVPFDIIYADPPYTLVDLPNKMRDLAQSIRTSLLLSEDGLLVTELGSDVLSTDFTGWRLIKSAVYGQTHLCYYKKDMK